MVNMFFLAPQALADGLGDLGGLTQAKADFALAVADDDQRGELHHAAALNGLADAVEGNDFSTYSLWVLFHCSRHFRFSSSL